MLDNKLTTTNNATVNEFFKQFGTVTYPIVTRNNYTQTIAVNANDGVMSRIQVWESEKHDRIDVYIGVLSNVYKFFSSFGHLNNKRAKRELKEICINMSYDSLVTLIETYNTINNRKSWKVTQESKTTKKSTKKREKTA